MAILLLLPGCGRRPISAAARDAARALETGRITRAEVLYIPREVETLVAMDPEGVDEGFYYKIVLREFDSSPFRREVLSALRRPDFVETDERADLRWGCVFYDAQNRRVFSMYFDGFGREGQLGDTRIRLAHRFGKLGLVRILEDRCSSIWE